MILNGVEKAIVNNPVRAALQRHVESRLLLSMAGSPLPPDARVLDIGCGRGVGTEIVLDVFGAAHVDAFDLDVHMVDLARARLASRGDRVRVSVGDAERIDAPDAHYDAVFDFAIIHHVPDWRRTLAEVHRVLKPGGRLYAEEVLQKFIHDPIWRRVLDHPMHDRFDHVTFANALRAQGFVIEGDRQFFGWFGFYVARRSA